MREFNSDTGVRYRRPCCVGVGRAQRIVEVMVRCKKHCKCRRGGALSRVQCMTKVIWLGVSWLEVGLDLATHSSISLQNKGERRKGVHVCRLRVSVVEDVRLVRSFRWTFKASKNLHVTGKARTKTLMHRKKREKSQQRDQLTSVKMKLAFNFSSIRYVLWLHCSCHGFLLSAVCFHSQICILPSHPSSAFAVRTAATRSAAQPGNYSAGHQ